MIHNDHSNENFGPEEKHKSSIDLAIIFFSVGIIYIVCCMVFVIMG